jgi:hypothetical protein
MKAMRVRLVTVGALLCLGLMNATPTAAAPGGNGNGNGGGNGNGNGNAGGNGNNPPSLSATPELSSLALFGTSAAGMAGYALIRLRAGRRQDTITD